MGRLERLEQALDAAQKQIAQLHARVHELECALLDLTETDDDSTTVTI